MHTLAELLMCVNGGVLSIKMLNSIQSQTPRKSIGYITAATQISIHFTVLQFIIILK